VIAWAGVLAQAAVAIPLVIWVAVFGYTSFEAVNMLFVILGFFSLGVAAFNLLPTPPLDGATAWRIFPTLLARRRAGTPKPKERR
jgi:membrane-associated protease RseP (regulator of RpoE activity)